jgi:hypothetical protein
VKAAAARTPEQGLSLSRWIILVLILMALGAPDRASGQATNGVFEAQTGRLAAAGMEKAPAADDPVR